MMSQNVQPEMGHRNSWIFMRATVTIDVSLNEVREVLLQNGYIVKKIADTMIITKQTDKCGIILYVDHDMCRYSTTCINVSENCDMSKIRSYINIVKTLLSTYKIYRLANAILELLQFETDENVINVMKNIANRIKLLFDSCIIDMYVTGDNEVCIEYRTFEYCSGTLFVTFDLCDRDSVTEALNEIEKLCNILNIENINIRLLRSM